MAHYKVSYKVLSEQGATLKTIAKQIDDYASRIDAVRGKLGDDKLLQTTRVNLQKLSQQLEENRIVVNMAADVVEKCVEGYSGTEVIIVKKVDSVKAHNRDFYKNPVSVPSAGGEAAPISSGMRGGGGGGYSGGTTSNNTNVTANVTANETNVTFVDNSVTYNVTGETPAPVGDVSIGAGSVPDPVSSTAGVSGPDINLTMHSGISGVAAAGIAAGAGAVSAGAMFGASRLAAYLKEKSDKAKASGTEASELHKENTNNSSAESAEADYKNSELKLAEARAKLAALNVEGQGSDSVSK